MSMSYATKGSIACSKLRHSTRVNAVSKVCWKARWGPGETVGVDRGLRIFLRLVMFIGEGHCST